MLSETTKQEIQRAYTAFLESKNLKARYGQKLMIAEIAKTLGSIELDEENHRTSKEHICVIEAGTGTGKTVAYLLPALIIAKSLGKKLVVATATVALQEQIVNKDLPELLKHAGLKFSFSLAKGRGRYLCLSKLDQLLAEYESGLNPTRALYEDELPSVSAESYKLYQSMVESLSQNKWNGDRDTWPKALEQNEWQILTSDERQCMGRRCSNVGACSFFRARDSMQIADCIVTNHDFVLADLALGGGVILPAVEDTIYVFDEGHNLPQKTLNHFAQHSRVLSTIKWLEQSNKNLSTILGHVSGAGAVDKYAEQLPQIFTEAKLLLEQIYPLIQALASEISLESRQTHYRFEHGQVPDDFRQLAKYLEFSFERMAEFLNRMANEIASAMEDAHCPVPKVDLENHYPVIGSWRTRAESNRELWSSYATTDEKNSTPQVRWIALVEFGSGVDFEICSSPMLAAKALEHRLWDHCCGAIVTSATLAALGNFQRLQLRAGTPSDAHYAVVPSPFKFELATLEIPSFAVDASHADVHTLSLINHFPTLLNINEGTLVLFSSRRQMLDVFDELPERIRERILVQGENSKQEMIERHKERIDAGEGSVLFGLASFAEGVDLPGNYCTHVIIAKLPFAVPDDPIEAALYEWVESRGGNAFMEISVPDTAVKLVQACGRLLRTETDRGKISLLDRRVLTKKYGKTILNSLPPFTQIIHPE